MGRQQRLTKPRLLPHWLFDFSLFRVGQLRFSLNDAPQRTRVYSVNPTCPCAPGDSIFLNQTLNIATGFVTQACYSNIMGQLLDHVNHSEMFQEAFLFISWDFNHAGWNRGISKKQEPWSGSCQNCRRSQNWYKGHSFCATWQRARVPNFYYIFVIYITWLPTRWSLRNFLFFFLRWFYTFR